MSIVSGLDEEDEQSEDNLDIIANVYENITELVQTGNIMITENVIDNDKNMSYVLTVFANSLQRIP